ncbi:MAG: bifunctional 5,10-methylenetetrahydrofolate dehydrogenase/5,10-methenyltetrahydrofolate cyclohydrolase [Candidatus Velthaea sp.]
MGAVILDGRALAENLRADLRARTAILRGRGVAPRLTVVIAGEDAASVAYVNGLVRLGAKIGVDVVVDALRHDAAEPALRARLEYLGGDRNVHGIILQQPLPPHLALSAVADAIVVHKDVDAANPATSGRLASPDGAPFVPATAAAIMLLLENSPHAELAGVRACVIGRSKVVGLPVALLLTARSATVTVTHSKTRDLAHHTRDAAVLVAAAGVPGLVRADMVAAGATVIDAGTTYADGKVTGDVAYDEVAAVAGAITPVPGGVGPVTNAALMRNVVTAAERA